MPFFSAHDPGSGGRRARPPRWWALLLWPLLLALAASRAHPALAQSEPVHEHQLKGEFVERFTRFVEWPPKALPADRPLQVCVMGASAVGDEILRMTRVRPFNGRRALGRRLSAREDPSGCHLLYVGFQERTRLEELLPQVAARPVLTVSDAPGFGELGVQINFYRDVTRVRFEINLAAVQRSGLHYRSQLLRLGRQVGGER
jgi:hypothetical protein